MNCCMCNKPIDPERLEVFPDTRVCVSCSTEKPVVGFMVYAHKTAGYVELVKADDREGLRRAERAYRRAR